MQTVLAITSLNLLRNNAGPGFVAIYLQFDRRMQRMFDVA